MIERDFFHLLHLFHLRAFLHENKESTKISDYIPRATDGRRCPSSLRRPCSAKAPLRILWLVSFFVAPRIYQAQSPGRDPRVVVMSLSNTRIRLSRGSIYLLRNRFARSETPLSLSRLVARVTITSRTYLGYWQLGSISRERENQLRVRGAKKRTI